ncbi:hypothetical protein [Polluticoccus soli]|uniref:hypothetical protein n=1 Tax=Polluticoccus soli TaxID=3034150 RepID=UPI0023E152BB|nr:hypothetical protein [Flavipsychrobacter sp. JY13-12]
MKNILLLLLLVTGTYSCNAQPRQSEKQQQATTTEENKPQARWKVNKKYDDKGNLIGYDSSYVWTYSSKGGNIHSVEADSVMEAFRKQFNMEFPSFFNKRFDNPVWSDSLFRQDFIAPDYFMKRWDEHHSDMRQMMQQMDSLRNWFLKNNYPGLNSENKRL